MKRNENAIDFVHWTLTDCHNTKKTTHKKTKEQQTIPNLQTIIMILYTIFWWHKRHLFFKFSIVTANATHSSQVDKQNGTAYDENVKRDRCESWQQKEKEKRFNGKNKRNCVGYFVILMLSIPR